VFATETWNTKHQTDFFMLKWSKTHKCGRLNETRRNKP